ncbi:MAG: DNA polymerase III subunit alpha [Bacteroidetes bacterium GWF2_33_16]|nr:MAG: DNA polymerase III subunit alpha [Bacteroidetes bacterium GWE2_32_14]OFY03680.1 MAG: DNA polymerase III subunit alpha [Bacteroidetes bacterium GWF2_33_16]
MIPYSHLHVHTQYSILDGASDVPTLIKKAKEDGMPAVCITDHGNMFGVKHFYNEARKQNIKPIIGCEIYIASGSRFEKTGKEDRSGNHLILLAKNKTGYENLSKIVSYAWIEGFYYTPRIDWDLLRKYHEGIIASSACLGGEVPQEIMEKGEAAGEAKALEYKKLFGDDFYLELQRHKSGDPKKDEDVYKNQVKVNEVLIRIGKKHDIKIIATNDVHFINAEDAEAHDRLICLNTGRDLDDPTRMSYTKQEYFKTQVEMNALFADIPEALENTNEIVAKIEEYELERNPIMPEFELPEGFSNEDEYLRHITYKGAEKRYPEITDEIRERIDFELSVIQNMGFPGYFLIVQDFLNAARSMGVSVGPGRGSAAGSVVAYCNRITDIDPLKYNLLFERFLNPDRISMPDIDIDFDEDGRDKVIDWVVKKYGEKRVAQIITFGTMAAKMAIRDVARVEKLPLSESDRLAKLVPERPGITLKKAYEEVPELKKAKDSDNSLIVRTLKFAETLEGSVRHTGLHACGIIISRNDLIEHIPVCTSKDSNLLVTQFDGGHVESVGMLKMDFLGLKTLSIIKDAIETIKESKGVDIDIDNLPLDDEKTFDLYSHGETTGLFQFESAGMKKYLKTLRPNRFEDLIAMNALYRPGPIEYIPSFVNRKHGKDPINYDLPEMEEILKDTYGITVYQEQVMLLSQKLAGFSKGEADSLRKAMGKKKRDLMDKLKAKFLEGCKNNGFDLKIVNKIWNDWESFAEYAFNKSHSTCYAYVSYQTAYLKAHFPAEYMAAVLSRNFTDIKKITIFMDECRRMGISVLGPDVNESKLKFTVNQKGDIRFGLGAIKGVGENAVLKIVEERKENGNYKNIYDFIERISLSQVNKKTIEGLATAGAFDNLDTIARGQYFTLDNKETSFIENLIRYGNTFQSDKNTQQISLFGGKDTIEISKPPVPSVNEWQKLETLNREKEIIGVYLSAHPLDDFKLEIDNFSNASLSELNELGRLRGKELSVAGIVTEIKHGTSKNGNPYGFLTIQDYTDSFRFALFGKDYQDLRKYCYMDYPLLIKGNIQPKLYKEDELEFKIKSMMLLGEVRNNLVKSICITMPLQIIKPELITEIKEVALKNKGKAQLKFKVVDSEENISINLFSRTERIDISNELIAFLNKKSDIHFSIN